MTKYSYQNTTLFVYMSRAYIRYRLHLWCVKIYMSRHFFNDLIADITSKCTVSFQAVYRMLHNEHQCQKCAL